MTYLRRLFSHLKTSCFVAAILITAADTKPAHAQFCNRFGYFNLFNTCDNPFWPSYYLWDPFVGWRRYAPRPRPMTVAQQSLDELYPKDFQNVLIAAITVLQNNKACRDVVSGTNLPAGEDALTELAASRIIYANIPASVTVQDNVGNVYSVEVAAGANRLDGTITIYSGFNTIQFNPSELLSGTPLPPAPDKFGFQVLILLHELGHLTGAHGAHDPPRDIGADFNGMIARACLPDGRIAGAPVPAPPPAPSTPPPAPRPSPRPRPGHQLE